MSKKSILIFTKVPTVGLVKTRLSQSTPLSDIDVCLLAEAMLKDTITIASRCRADVIEIGYYPEQNFNKLVKIVDSIRDTNKISIPIEYHLQKGTSFDERFGSVVQSSKANGNEKIVVLGADLPYMPSSLIDSAFTHLTIESNRNNIVIGPAGEGGIYLVGISRNFNPAWFRKHNLFTGGVEIIQFSKFCKQERIGLHLLTPLIDIDIEDDLVTLLGFIEGLKIAETNENFHYPYYTTKFIESLRLHIKKIEGKTRNRRIGK